MINYKIKNGAIDYSTKINSLWSLIYISLTLKQGAWFFNPAFGCRWYLIKKLDADGLSRAEDYSKEALKWLLDLKKLDSISVNCQPASGDIGRCNVHITAIKKDIIEIEFETFFRVL